MSTRGFAGRKVIVVIELGDSTHLPSIIGIFEDSKENVKEYILSIFNDDEDYVRTNVVIRETYTERA